MMMSAGGELNWQDGTVRFQCASGDDDRIGEVPQENQRDHVVQGDLRLDQDHQGDGSVTELGSELHLLEQESRTYVFMTLNKTGDLRHRVCDQDCQ